jgi:uncharacterized DUF497 family protein
MFSWDAAKTLKNDEKHGVSFEKTATAFDDPNAIEVEDLEPVHRSEGDGSESLVIFALRSLKNGTETIRASVHGKRRAGSAS